MCLYSLNEHFKFNAPALILSCRHAGIVEQTSAEHWISLIVNLLHMYCMLLAIRKSAVVFMLLANTPAITKYVSMMPINSMQLLHLQTYPRFLVAAFTNPAMSGVHLCRGVLPFLLQMDGSAPSCTRKQAIVALPLPGGMWYSSRTWSRDVAHHNIGVDRHSVSTYGGLIASGLFKHVAHCRIHHHELWDSQSDNSNMASVSLTSGFSRLTSCTTWRPT